jgi:hypothetical protein
VVNDKYVGFSPTLLSGFFPLRLERFALWQEGRITIRPHRQWRTDITSIYVRNSQWKIGGCLGYLLLL